MLAHLYAPLHVTTRKGNYDVIFAKYLLQELETELDFQNNILGRQDINLPMKLEDCTLRIYFTVKDTKNIRKTTKRSKKILDANYTQANLKKIVHNLNHP